MASDSDIRRRIRLGRKGRDFLRRRYPTAQEGQARTAPVEVTGEHVGILAKVQFGQARDIAEYVVERYTAGEIDSAYLVYNEFKSVIAQRLVVDEILPIVQIGATDIKQAEE